MRKLHSNDAVAYFSDMLSSIAYIEAFVGAMGFADFLHDEKTSSAVERKLLIVSEAAFRLGDGAERLCPGIPWGEIRGMGNWVRHHYDKMELQTIWNVVHDDLPVLKQKVSEGDREA